ncbi:Nin one binding Zn-ribbon like-domain-containing protein [Coemansia spiralis]|nr:Nin one binding Zn-ribbon like-domain-containing protein [Coemansia spiralis]
MSVLVPDTADTTEAASPSPINTATEQLKPAKAKKKQPNSGKPVATLVVDTNAFIKGLVLDPIATKFVTIPEVRQELRSRGARDRYHELDLRRGISVMEPDSESLRVVYEFAKKTGDFASLARADLKVIALAFMLEKQANGMKRLRLEPRGTRPEISDRRMLASDNGGQAEDSEQVEQLEDGDGANEGEQVEPPENSSEEDAQVEPLDNGGEEDEQAVPEVAGISEQMEQLAIDSADDQQSEQQSESETGSGDDDGWQVAGPKRGKQQAPRVDDFFNGAWITPANVQRHQAANAMGMKEAQRQRPSKILKVACVTADFAMQNVLLSMGINLVTPDGVSVRSLRTWVLRCHACFHLTGNMDRQFCPECGHPTLKRCSVTTGADGHVQVHLKTNYKHNLRGTIYSLPQTRGGPHRKTDVITRADDKAYLRAMQYKTRRDAKVDAASGAGSLMDPDFIPDLLLGAKHDAKGHGVATDARGMPMVARNSRNPNVVRKTGNRKKKRSKI